MAANSSGFFIQSTYGVKGNFEVIVPRKGGGLDHYYRDNDEAGFPWYGPYWYGPDIMFGSSKTVNGASLIQSNYGNPGNLEIVSWEGNNLQHCYGNDIQQWKWYFTTILPDGSNIMGAPALIQSNYGKKGNFEVVAPVTGGGLAHWYRDNDKAGYPWYGPYLFGSGNVEAVALIQSNFGKPGNLEVIARIGNQLIHYYRDSSTLEWHSTGMVTSGITGQSGFIQSNYGTKGNFELVVPMDSGGLGYWYRDNDSIPYNWYGSTIIGVGFFSEVSLIQSNYGTIGDLEVVAKQGDKYIHYSRQDQSPWEWSEPTILPQPPVFDPEIAGESSIASYVWPVVGAHSSLLPDSRSLMFSFLEFDPSEPVSTIYHYDGNGMEMVEVSHHLFNSGHTFLSDGKLLTVGGNGKDLKSLYVFDPDEQKWIYKCPLQNGRWSPTCAALPGKKVFIISGTKGKGGDISPDSPVNNTLQIYDEVTGLGTEKALPSPFSSYFPQGFNTIDLYPFVYSLPNGEVLVHSRNTTRFYNPSTDTWSNVELRTKYPYSRSYPVAGTSVLLPLLPESDPPYRARILVAGGGGSEPENVTQDTPATNTVEILDLGEMAPQWRYATPMEYPRVMPDSVLLPDGTILVVNGSASGSAKAGNVGIEPVMNIEIFDPKKEIWTTMCTMNVPRLYNSTAILLSDGRVMIAGKDGVYNQTPYQYPEYRVEMYSPPYLFSGPRPVILKIDEHVGYGYSSTIEIDNTSVAASNITSAALIRPGSVTHSINMSQRFIGLEIIDRTETTVTVQMPPNANVGPEGYYMLFLLSDKGVPSVASFTLLKRLL